MKAEQKDVVVVVAREARLSFKDLRFQKCRQVPIVVFRVKPSHRGEREIERDSSARVKVSLRSARRKECV